MAPMICILSVFSIFAYHSIQLFTMICTFTTVRTCLRCCIGRLLFSLLTDLNDLHSGYHIFGAAVVAHFDPEWGRCVTLCISIVRIAHYGLTYLSRHHFQRVLLLIRNIANPHEDDGYFPTWRHKDWFQGHSWASGIVRPPYRNGRNQESSSEAIAAYEAITVYGSAMYVYSCVMIRPVDLQ
jgi:Glycosyl hydrolase family 81 C-terminal domain